MQDFLAFVGAPETQERVAAFFSVTNDLTVWDVINAPLFVALVAAALAWVLKDRVEGFVQEVVADSAEVQQRQQETGPPLPDGPTTPAPANSLFEEGSQLMAEIKEEVERAVSMSDGRNRRKYRRFPRYDYRPLVQALEDDRNIDGATGNLMLSAFERWRPFQRGRAIVPLEVTQELAAILAALKKRRGDDDEGDDNDN